MRQSILARLLVLLGLGVAAAGVGATAYWILTVDDPGRLWRLRSVASLGLLVTVAITALNVALRWVRWHYLTRRVGAGLTTRDSLLVFLGTLPAILTPFYTGELVRAVLIGKRYPAQRVNVALIWLIERSSDLLLVSTLLLVTRGAGWIALLSIAAWVVLMATIRRFFRVRRAGDFPRRGTLGALLSLTAASSLLPPLALWSVLRLLEAGQGFGDTVGVYAHSALLGNLSGLPIGISVTGSSMMLELRRGGVGLEDAVVATWVFRVATVWFVLAFGSLVAWAYRGSLLEMLRAPASREHFDEIAPTYEAEMSRHVRHRLVERKTRVMLDHLAARSADDAPLVGLDVGCGPGWYACEMAHQGHVLHAVDTSGGQLASARDNARRTGLPVTVQVTRAEQLPFPDASFDYAYAINLLHHITDEGARSRAFSEILRVLKPGGVFFLQEINTENPAFRFYMGYVFPLIRAIDEGTERWIPPSELPPAPGGHWQEDVDFFTFLPDFAPEIALRALGGLERRLERSRLRTWSAHYAARLVRDPV